MATYSISTFFNLGLLLLFANAMPLLANAKTQYHNFVVWLLSLLFFPSVFLFRLSIWELKCHWNRFKQHQWRGCAIPLAPSRWTGNIQDPRWKWTTETRLWSTLSTKVNTYHHPLVIAWIHACMFLKLEQEIKWYNVVTCIWIAHMGGDSIAEQEIHTRLWH